MELIVIEGQKHVKLTLQEALPRVAELWKRHPNTSLQDLFAEDLAKMRGEPNGAAPVIDRATSGRELASPFVPKRTT